MDRYPIHRLDANINRYLLRIITADIENCVNSGLRNQVDFVDEMNHISDIASIFKNPVTTKSEVRLSAAYCQFFWLICDVALKIMDYNMLLDELNSHAVSIEQYKQSTDVLTKLSYDTIKQIIPYNLRVNIAQYISYLQCTQQFFDENFADMLRDEFNCALTIVDSSCHIDVYTLEKLNLDGLYEQRVNSIYTYGVAFLMLHELSHHALGHVDRENYEGDEENADMAAFWSVFNDITDEYRFSAMSAILCVFFSFMILDPSLTDDGIHPRDDKRLFMIYDQIKDESPKYTQLVIGLFDFWAKIYCVKNFPTDLSINDSSIVKIRKFLDEYLYNGSV